MEFQWIFLFAKIAQINVFGLHAFLPSVVHQQMFQNLLWTP